MMGMSDYDLTDALELPRHGGPEDRGSADAYYGRDPQPHYFEGVRYNPQSALTNYSGAFGVL